MRAHVTTTHPDFLNKPPTEDEASALQSYPKTELSEVISEELFNLISMSLGDMDFSLEHQGPKIEENLITTGDHYQINGSVIRYCRK